jgi:putative ABC transport system substrate-binding protein
MRRRDFITLLGGATVAWPLAAHAQHADRVFRVGILSPSLANPVDGPGFKAFVSELQKLGFTEGKNLVVEYRRADEGAIKAFTAANELGAARTDVIVAAGPEIALQAAAAVRPVVPIVMLANNFDPVARGYVAGLSRSGGNITGLIERGPELATKQLEFLVEACPDLHVSLHPIKLDNPPYDFDAAFQMMARDEVSMLLVLSSPLFTPQAPHIAELAIRFRLPSMFIFRLYVEAGGLMSYGFEPLFGYLRAASYVAKILRGAPPAELPVEQIDRFEFALNLKTAKAIGISLPTSILLRADEVIE